MENPDVTDMHKKGLQAIGSLSILATCRCSGSESGVFSDLDGVTVNLFAFNGSCDFSGA